MSTPADDTTRSGESGSASPGPETSYLSRPGGRIGCDVALITGAPRRWLPDRLLSH